MNIDNIQFTNDPFADDSAQDNFVSKNKIHIRLQQRNAKKSITTIQGLDHKKVNVIVELKKMKKIFSCNGNIVEDDEYEKVIQLQGDHRIATKTYLMEKLGYNVDNIKIHGY